MGRRVRPFYFQRAKKMKLYVPINSESTKALIHEISDRLLTVGEYEPHHEKEHVEQIEALAEIMSGLSSADFAELSVPDYNSACELVQAQIYKPDELRGKLAAGVDFVDLLQSITDETGEEIKSVKIKVPSLKALRMRDKQGAGEMLRALWMTSYCTDIAPNDLRKLAMPDWIAIQSRVGSFLSKTAATFRSGTSTI